MFTISTEQAIRAEGLEISVILPKGLATELISLSSEVMDIASNEYYYNAQTGILKYVSLNAVDLAEFTESMKIVVSADVDVTAKVSINWVKDDVLVRSKIKKEATLDRDKSILIQDQLLVSNVIFNMVLLEKHILLGKVKVYDMRGNLVYTAVNTNNRLDVSSMPQGMYILQWTDGRVIKEAKFIKK